MPRGRPATVIPTASAKVLQAKWAKVQKAEAELDAANNDLRETLKRAYANGIAFSAIARLLSIAPTTVRYRAGMPMVAGPESSEPQPYIPKKARVNYQQLVQSNIEVLVQASAREQLKKMLCALGDWREDWRGHEHSALEAERSLIDAYDAATDAAIHFTTTTTY